MDTAQTNKTAMFNAVVDLLDASTALVSTIPALTAALAAFRTQTDSIRALSGAQLKPTTGITADKQAALTAMTEAALAVAGGTLSHATQNRLGDLAARVDLTRTDFVVGREVVHVTLAEQIHAAATEVGATLADHGVTPADLADLRTKIDAARVALNAPRSAVGAKRSATHQLADAIDRAEEILTGRLDALAVKLAQQNPDFGEKYQAARVVIDRPGGRASPAATPPPVPPPPAVSSSNPPAVSTAEPSPSNGSATPQAGSPPNPKAA